MQPEIEQKDPQEDALYAPQNWMHREINNLLGRIEHDYGNQVHIKHEYYPLAYNDHMR